MDRYLFIVNPTAGSGRTKAYVDYIQDYMSNMDMEYKISITTKPKEATEMVIGSPKYNICVAVGGDGTALSLIHI